MSNVADTAAPAVALLRRLGVGIACTALAMAALGAPPASASSTQESMFQDDDQLIYDSPEGAAHALDTLHSLGVDRIRVTVVWRLVAPAPDSRTRPAGFDGADPAAYPADAFNRYDQLVVMARDRGIGVNFDVTGPAPTWASTGTSPRADLVPMFRPSANEFGQFVTALGRRYDGTYTLPVNRAARAAGAERAQSAPAVTRACDPGLLGVLSSCPSPPPPPPSSPPAGSPPGSPPTVLPRVSFWSLWNEPNQGGWLDPQWTLARGRRWAETAPSLYRSLADNAFGALQSTGHGADTLLIGETAPSGVVKQGTTRAIRLLGFVRALYCLDDGYRVLRGAAAGARGCPATGVRASFAAAHPVLFAATGWSHHPYTAKLEGDPAVRPSDAESATISTLGRLSSALRRATGAYGRARDFPLYLTEFGFQTPPSPRGVPYSEQAAWLNESEFMAYSNPLVRAFSQFLLVDSALHPPAGAPASRHGVTFQTGLQARGGRTKPSYDAYRLPLYIPRSRVPRGHALRVWGLVRGARSTVTVSVEETSHGRTSLLARASTNDHGFIDLRLPVARPGSITLAYRPPTGDLLHSRAVAVTLGR